MKTAENIETGCCPRFDPKQWQKKKVEFNDKLFLKDHVKSIFHIPLNYASVMKRDMEMIDQAGAKADALILNDERSLWKSDVLVAVDKEIPGAEMEHLSGHFLTKVYEGPYNNMRKYIEDMKLFLTQKGESSDKFYFYYTYCPKCAKAYGKNYIVIFAHLNRMAA